MNAEGRIGSIARRWSFIILHSAFILREVGPMERLALSWGNARQFTKLLLSLLSHIGKEWLAEPKLTAGEIIVPDRGSKSAVLRTRGQNHSSSTARSVELVQSSQTPHKF